MQRKKTAAASVDFKQQGCLQECGHWLAKRWWGSADALIEIAHQMTGADSGIMHAAFGRGSCNL